jgi:hypothetical protein
VGAREHCTYEIVPEQANAIRWAAGKVADGWSLARIADALDRQGLRGGHGGKITPVAVRSWLTAPSIAGHRVHRGTDLGPGSGNWPAILDEQMWREVGAVLAQPRIVRRRDGGTYPVTTAHTGPAGRKYLLTGGLARCDVCSAPTRQRQLRRAWQGRAGRARLGGRHRPRPGTAARTGPAPPGRRAGRDLEAALTASLANAKPGPEVKPEPGENWELKQGDRIMRMLAEYGAEGVDPQTMSAGMHDMPTTKIRSHLRRLAKADNSPVEEVETGKYRRRPTGPGQPG